MSRVWKSDANLAEPQEVPAEEWEQSFCKLQAIEVGRSRSRSSRKTPRQKWMTEVGLTSVAAPKSSSPKSFVRQTDRTWTLKLIT